VPFPLVAVATAAMQADQQGRASGGPGLFEFQSLRSGPQPGDQYGAFKPGGMFAPPSLAQFQEAAKGRNVGLTIGSALAPGLGQAIGALVSGPGRGQMRREAARGSAQQDPGLMAILGALRASGLGPTSSAASIAQGVAAELRRNPQAAQSLAGVLSRAQALGGIGSAQGEQANQLGDVLKFTFGLGTVRRPGAPTALDVIGALQPMLRPSQVSTPGGFGPPVVVSSAPAVSSIPQQPQSTFQSTPARASSYWSSMGTRYTPGRFA